MADRAAALAAMASMRRATFRALFAAPLLPLTTREEAFPARNHGEQPLPNKKKPMEMAAKSLDASTTHVKEQFDALDKPMRDALLRIRSLNDLQMDAMVSYAFERMEKSKEEIETMLRKKNDFFLAVNKLVDGGAPPETPLSGDLFVMMEEFERSKVRALAAIEEAGELFHRQAETFNRLYPPSLSL